VAGELGDQFTQLAANGIFRVVAEFVDRPNVTPHIFGRKMTVIGDLQLRMGRLHRLLLLEIILLDEILARTGYGEDNLD
jgi:hypothetical protein